MASNKSFFLEQQEEAFYAHNFYTFQLSELETYLDKYKSKKETQFPPPRYIYEKDFAFLQAPLRILQKDMKKELPKSANQQVVQSNNIYNE